MDEFLSVAEAAGMLINVRTGQPGVHTQRVYQLIRAQQRGLRGLAAQRIGHQWVIERGEVERFNRQREKLNGETTDG